MCPQIPHTSRRSNAWYRKTSTQFLLAFLFAVLSVISGISLVVQTATFVADVFMRLLRLVSVPILFFSVVSVFSSLDGHGHAKKITMRITKYTLLTTLIAASIGLLFVNVFGLMQHGGDGSLAISSAMEAADAVKMSTDYSSWLLDAVPSNIVRPFADNNAIAALILALLLGISSHQLPPESKVRIHHFFSSIYDLLMQATIFIVRFIPIILWAFLTLLLQEISNLESFEKILRFFAAVLAANLVQGCIVLPLLLKWKKISTYKLVRSFSPALSMAFVTKSSSATAPLAIDCATKRAGIKESIARISFPLCTSINMNGCAAFIVISVMFVGSCEGVVFSGLDQFVWIFVATIAAIGNAGVPMGCYFLSCALLASMNVPIHLMGAILPLYGIIDAVETSLNIWSDSCVTAIVDTEIQQEI